MNTRKKSPRRHTAQQPPILHSGQRLRSVLNTYGIPPTAFAEWMRISPQCLNNWFSRGLPVARMEKLATTLSVSKVWLETGERGK
ncbi:MULTISPECIES: hypothetical protein [Pseudomonas]|jgi:hypothetical protein|uniref:Transcriptional regulator n=1 Tax=Pseudomonas fluorescens LMG 5329 TaxID=1324332 RepID=A0A0A1Z4K2_PSEFL|nr:MULTISPECIES: hypothetical protein [Pseudomonas]KGE67682.1 hypothetical protein K814_0112135 [Pseudomonas fluorescens LMG 5329]NWE04983.1 hypothetical protein [Pseudomonas sp. IPO3749]NWF24458.1 hypothetical protein [Pseudomonas sp. IPO3749]